MRMRPDAGRTTPAYEVCREIEALADEWDGLADRTGAVPYLRPGWIGAWWRAFGSGALEVVLIRRDDRLAGLVPLARARGTLRSPTNWHTVAFGLLAEDPAAARDVARAVFARRARSAQLAFIDPEGQDLPALRWAAQEAGYTVFERAYVRSPYLRIDGDWASYEHTLSKNVRNDVARRRRRLGDAGSVTIEVMDGRDDLDRLLEDGFKVEASGWKAARGTAIGSREHTRTFYAEVARWAATRGCLRLAFLRLDGRAIAFVYDFEDAGVHYYMKGGYDPAFGRFSPAKVLLHAMVERAFAIGLERFEFLGGEDPYKLHWANATRELSLFQAFAPTPLGFLERLAYTRARPLAKRALAALRR